MKKRFAILLVVAAVIAGARHLFLSLGYILHREDVLTAADVIYVLGGTRVERVAEAGELYREGLAPLILLSRQVSEPAEIQLRASGLRIPTETQIQRNVLQQMGIPAEAVLEVTAEQVATTNEVDELAQISTARQWRRIIVVTSKMHTARAGLVMRRRLRPLGKEVMMRGSRYDDAEIERWWSNRSDLRFVVIESQKLLAYAMGLED